MIRQLLFIAIIISTGCNLDVVTSIPTEAAEARPAIQASEIEDIFVNYHIRSDTIKATEFGRYVYYIATIEEVRDIQSGAWSLIAQSPYDAKHRNCVDFANALYPMLTWSLCSAPVAVVFYWGFCWFPECPTLKIDRHALIMMVTQDHELMFVEPRQRGNIYAFPDDIIIMEIRI